MHLPEPEWADRLDRGRPGGTGGDIILSHNNGSGNSFASITLNNCNFASGSATMGVALNLVITNQTQIGFVNTYCPNTTIQQTTFPFEFVGMRSGATNLTVQNCLFKPSFALSQSPAYFGFLLAGNVTIQGCTFDLSGFTGNSTTISSRASSNGRARSTSRSRTTPTWFLPAKICRCFMVRPHRTR